MKKFLLCCLLVGCTFSLLGCQNERHIQDLQSLQSAVDVLQQRLLSWLVEVDDAQIQVRQLLDTYQELTKQEVTLATQSLDRTLADEQQKIEKLGILPLRATQLWLTVPQGMKLQKTLSRQVQAGTTWYDAFVLVYKGTYDKAVQEAQRIASGAKLFLSPEIAQAQAMVKSGKVISGFNTQELMDSLIYTNHNHLDTAVATIISVSVTKEWLLTLEATNYKK